MKYYFDVLKNYANFNGRARRSEYWYFVLFNLLISITLMFLTVSMSIPLLYNIYALGVLIPSIAVAVRRMHDVGKSGWYCLIPIYNLVLACTDGTPGMNEYGQNPKEDPHTFDFEQEQPSAQ